MNYISQEIEVEEVVHHAEYNAGGRQENDVAVIRLKTPATLGREGHFHFFQLSGSLIFPTIFPF